MQRFTISLDDALAAQFDTWIAAAGYENRSEAVRDLIRTRLGHASMTERATTRTAAEHQPWCVAVVSFVYDHHDRTVAARVLDVQHDHHDLVITSLHTHLDHDDCLEAVVLRGPVQQVAGFAERLVALRGVRHGQAQLVPLAEPSAMHHHAGDGAAHPHRSPIN